MAAIKVTVCVPVYGVEKYIGKCVRSLMEQTYPEIEYLFVDDCTKDRSMEVLEQTLQDYPDRRSGRLCCGGHYCAGDGSDASDPESLQKR